MKDKLERAYSFWIKAIDRINEYTDKHKSIYLLRSLSRAIVLYFVFLLCYTVICGKAPDLDNMYDYDGRLTMAIRAVSVFFTYYSLIYTFRCYDTRAHRRFSKEEKFESSVSLRIAKAVVYREFIIEILVIFALTLLPIEKNTLMHNEALTAVFYKAVIPAESRLIYICTIHFPLYLILGFLANYAARSVWYSKIDPNQIREESSGYIPHNNRYWWNKKKRKAIVEAIPKFIRDIGNIIKALILAIVVYSIGFGSLPAFASTLSKIATLLWRELGNTLIFIIIFIIALVNILIYRRIFASRMKFMRELKKLCKNQKFKLSKVKPATRSLFRADDTSDFTVEANGKTYECKLIPSKRKRAETTFFESGYYVNQLNVRILFVDLSGLATAKNFLFESRHQKILILNPAPRRALILRDKSLRELDVGDIINDYKIYNGSGFLNALGRNCIERRMNT